MAVLAILAEVAATGGSPAHAQALHDLLTPFAGRLVTAQLGLACLGAADRYLGVLSTLLERWDKTRMRSSTAPRSSKRASVAAPCSRTGYWRARFLHAHGGAHDAATANAMLHDVVDETSSLGMQRLCAQAEDLLTA